MTFWKGVYLASVAASVLTMMIAAPRAWGVGDGGVSPAVRAAAAAGGRPSYVFTGGFWGGK